MPTSHRFPFIAATTALVCVASTPAQSPAAAEILLRPVADSGNDPTSRFLLGYALIQLNRFEEAEIWLRRAAAARPDQPAWLLALAKSLLEQDQNLAAIEVLDQALALTPTAELHYAKAMGALNAGKEGLAEAELRHTLRLQPDHADALFKLARVRIDRGHYGSALPYLRRALAANPGHLEAHYLFGLAASRTGDLLAAETAYRDVMSMVPGHVGAMYDLGRVLLQQGRTDEGREEDALRAEFFAAQLERPCRSKRLSSLRSAVSCS